MKIIELRARNTLLHWEQANNSDGMPPNQKVNKADKAKDCNYRHYCKEWTD